MHNNLHSQHESFGLIASIARRAELGEAQLRAIAAESGLPYLLVLIAHDQALSEPRVTELDVNEYVAWRGY